MISIKKRVFLIVLDSFGVGEAPDAAEYGDEGSNTIKAVSKSSFFKVQNMRNLGLFNINGLNFLENHESPIGSFARMLEVSKGKDTTTGHWEIAGLESTKPMPTYPNGFPKEIINDFERLTGRKVICNKPYSGTDVIRDFGKEHLESGGLIVYTSADSVFQIAAHEEKVPIEELYRYCKIARSLLNGDNSVGRVIARPFIGEYPNFTRTSNRHDFSLMPPSETMLDVLVENNKCVLAVGKINDIFAGRGISEFVRTKNNSDGMDKTFEFMKKDFDGLCFVNLVDFDMLYGHRNDVDGYAKALSDFDVRLGILLSELRDSDVLMITADHGCDPSTPSTDHSREYVPLLVYGKNLKSNVNLGTRKTFSDIAATILDMFDIKKKVKGMSFLREIMKGEKSF